MRVFDGMAPDDHEQVLFSRDRASGLRCIVAIHSTRLGPALGGTRFHPYRSEDEALADVLRLARMMTYKAAVSGLDLGGGKAVILGDPATLRSEALLRAYGRVVDSLGGRYITAPDVGTTQQDMETIRRQTESVTGVSQALGGSGDTSAATAHGLAEAMKAVARHCWGDVSLKGRHVAVAGVGKVGMHLARRLVTLGARVTVADVRPEAVAVAVGELGTEAVPADAVHRTPCDIYSPCALGGSLHPGTIPELRCAAVVGGANNQLADAASAPMLADAGVVYAPDYVVNAGGLINVAEELSPSGYQQARAYGQIGRIFDTTASVLATAEAEGTTTAEAADRVAERRIEEVGSLPRIRTFHS